MIFRITILFALLAYSCLGLAQSYTIVWPGDANNNGIVNNHDLLYMGLAYGQTGPSTNSGGDIAWNSNISTYWGTTIGNMCDIAYADCNGDGVVNAQDTTAIISNYNSTHDIPYPETFIDGIYGVDPPLALISVDDSIEQGSTVSLDLNIGTSSIPVNDFHGIAFSVLYDPTVISPNSMRALLNHNSWLSSATSAMNLIIDEDDYANGRIDVAITLTQQSNISGFGNLGTLDFVIEDNLIGKDNAAAVTLDLQIIDIHVIDNQSNYIPIASQRLLLNIFGEPEVTSIQKTFDTQFVKAYPNPVIDVLNLSAEQVNIETVEILNVTGELVERLFSRENDLSAIDVSNFSRGLYFFKVYTSDGIELKKISVQ